jgi:hypothetical protein
MRLTSSGSTWTFFEPVNTKTGTRIDSSEGDGVACHRADVIIPTQRPCPQRILPAIEV